MFCRDTTVPTTALKDSADILVFADEKSGQPEVEPYILCRRCRQAITRPADQISINGAHRHTFANPNGIVYEIGCFQAVIGCGYVGRASNEFTWFPGYSWRTLVCTGCLSHLGWSFISASSVFYGLIPDHLIFPR